MLTISRCTVRTARVAALLVLTGLLGACGTASITAPASNRSVHASASHDGNPPDSPCISGWEQTTGGDWVCADGI